MTRRQSSPARCVATRSRWRGSSSASFPRSPRRSREDMPASERRTNGRRRRKSRAGGGRENLGAGLNAASRDSRQASSGTRWHLRAHSAALGVAGGGGRKRRSRSEAPTRPNSLKTLRGVPNSVAAEIAFVEPVGLAEAPGEEAATEGASRRRSPRPSRGRRNARLRRNTRSASRHRDGTIRDRGRGLPRV